MRMHDEPVLGPAFDRPPAGGDEDLALPERIRQLVNDQPYAVLCTQGDGQPYGSVVAFAFSPDLTTAVFATPVATRKYRLLMACEQVALVVDNRPTYPDDLMKTEAITATGRARQQEPGPMFERCAALLTARHPYLAAFVASASCALFCVEIVRFFHVVRFQEVQQWIPTPNA